MSAYPSAAAAETAFVIRCQDGFWSCEMCHHETRDEVNRVNGKDVCRECMNVCSVCGEWITDDSFDGPEVRIGRNSFAHKQCAEEDA